jgi:universal stress protein A
MLWAREGIPMDIHNILVPTDFSADAAYALQQALVLAAREHAHVLLLHVLSRPEIMWPEVVWPMRAHLVHEVQDEAEQRLQAVAAAQPFPIATLVLWGNPATEICRMAQGYGTDLIVMSTHGRTGLAHLFMGSIAERVVRSAPCSVLIVRSFQPKEAPADQPSVLRYLDQHSTGEPAWWKVWPYLAVPWDAGAAYHPVSVEHTTLRGGDRVTHRIEGKANR